MDSRVELFAAIRRDARVEGLSIRALAVRYRVHRRTARQALESAVPPPRKPPRRSAPALEPVRELIDEMLRADVSAPRKQRHTCRRIFERLVDEHGAQVSYSTVVAYVGHRRPQIEGEAWDRAGVLEGLCRRRTSRAGTPRSTRRCVAAAGRDAGQVPPARAGPGHRVAGGVQRLPRRSRCR